MFEIIPANETTHTRIALRGELTSATAPQLEAALAALLATGAKRWLLDLGALAFSSSAGLRVFLSYAKKIKNASGRLVFCAVQPAVLEVLETSGFTQILTLTPTAEDGRRLLAQA
jgi:anti-anti-sigma factor